MSAGSLPPGRGPRVRGEVRGDLSAPDAAELEDLRRAASEAPPHTREAIAQGLAAGEQNALLSGLRVFSRFPRLRSTTRSFNWGNGRSPLQVPGPSWCLGAFVCVAFERRVFSRGLMAAEGRMPRSRFASAGRCLCATGRNCLQALKLAFHWKGPLRGGLKEAFCAHFGLHWKAFLRSAHGTPSCSRLPSTGGRFLRGGLKAPCVLTFQPSAGSPFCANGEKPLRCAEGASSGTLFERRPTGRSGPG